MRMFANGILGVMVLAAAGCATSGFPDVVDVRDVSTTFGPPSVSRIRDVGAVPLPQTGAWNGESDGVAGPGELVILEGENFGRLPTVSIGGRATAVGARTEGGGIIARVPTGVPVGDVAIVVATPKGRAEKKFPIRRFAVVVHDGQLLFLRVEKDRAELIGKSLPAPGARAVRISSDGAAAYVVVNRPDGDYLAAIDLCAPGGPRIASEKKLAHHGALLASAMDAPIVAVVGDREITILATREPRAPALFEPMDLPMGAKGPHAVELSPDGKLLAVLVSEGNRLVALDVSSPPNGNVVTSVDLLPDQKLPLVRDLAFASDGETLWIVSGDNDKSLPALQPTRLTAVRILPAEKADEAKKNERLVSVWRTQSVPGAAAPLRIAIARGQPLASGTTIRMPPDKAAVFVTALNDAIFKLADVALETPAGAKAAAKLWHPPQPGMLVRADINGGGGPLFSTVELLSAVDLTPDAQLVVATAARVSPVPATGGVVLDFGVTFAPIWATTIAPVFLSLGKIDAKEVKPPFLIGDVRIQP